MSFERESSCRSQVVSRVPILFFFFLLLTFPDVLDTLRSYLLAVQNVVGAPATFFERLATPGAGEDVLPKVTRESLLLIRQLGIHEYSISSQYGGDTLLLQRISEAAWPDRLTSNAKDKLVFNAERSNYADCPVVAEQSEISLVRCP